MPLVTGGADGGCACTYTLRDLPSRSEYSPSPWVNDHLRVNGLECGTYARCMHGDGEAAADGSNSLPSLELVPKPNCAQRSA